MAMFQTAKYEAIAAILRKSQMHIRTDTPFDAHKAQEDLYDAILNEFVTYFKADNENFSEAQFRAAIWKRG